MNDNVYVYVIPLPSQIDEMVVPCPDGYTVYISIDLDEAGRMEAYEHALGHIRRNDWQKVNVQAIEYEAHHQTAAEPPEETAPAKPKRKKWSRTEAYLRKEAKRAKALAKHGLYESVEFVDGEYGEIVARKVYRHA